MKNHWHYTTLMLLLLWPCAATFAQPKAAFSSNTTEGCTPLIVQFTDLSAQNPTNWRWDFGNGNTSTQQNPGVIYVQPGTYTIKLVAGNASGVDSVIKTAYITVYAKPDIQFTATPLTGCVPLNVQFSSQSTAGSGTITEYIWDFGDGKISPDVNPVHTYNTVDSFDISLTVKNSYGCKQLLQQKALVKVVDNVTAAYSFSFANGCAQSNAIKFTNQSTATGTLTYQWSFGDGQTATDASPAHTYSGAGSYNAQLVAISSSGCSDTIVQAVTIGQSKTDFTSAANACTGKPVAFTNASAPAPTIVTWIFGDGQTGSGINTQHTYTNPGTYVVTMKADFGGCTDSVSKPVTITNKPAGSFTTAVPASCTTPVTVQFNNTATGAVAYKWNFGDGDSSADVNPAHTYLNAGYYTITLISFNANGCSDTLVKTNGVRIGPGRISGISTLPYSGCAPATVQMGLLYDSVQNITSYAWDFGDGTFSNEANPSHNYAQPGNYNVTVVISTNTGCKDTFSIQTGVSLAQRPKADFSASPLALCGSRPFQFTDASSADATAWLWLFGDGQSSAQQNPTHGYKDTGYYTITLIASNKLCRDTMIKTQYLHVDAPIARFNITYDCTAPYRRFFTDVSIGGNTWQWDFGDGQTASGKNVNHTYSTPGTYTVRLTVSNGSCFDSTSMPVYIVDDHPSFTIAPSIPPCKYQSVQFTAQQYSVGAIGAFYWDFGDGTNSGFSSTYATIKHVYQKAGSYNVTLKVKDMNGCVITAAQQAPVVVYGPTAAFSNPAGTCLQKRGAITFNDMSATDGSHAIAKWDWSFGDNNTQSYTTGPFAHAYAAVGIYTVVLKVTDTYGCSDSIIKGNAVTITNPKAAFTLSDTLRCSSNNISFINQSSGSSLTYAWSFGDGQQSTQPSPVHSYASEGVYNVALAIKDVFGCTDSAYKTNALTVANPHASFNLLDTFISCPPLIVSPQNTSQAYRSSYWDFKDGTSSILTNPEHAYVQGGLYKLTLIVTGYGACVDSASRLVTVKGPSGTLSYSPLAGCNTLNVAFKATTKNTSTLAWDFGDGTVLQTMDSLVSHTYDSYGRYVPRIVLIDSANCKVSIFTNDTIRVAGISANMALGLQKGCDSSLVTYKDSSAVFYDQITSYTWTTGDGVTLTGNNASHYYKTTGTYNVNLTVATASGCSSTVTKSFGVQVYKSPHAAAAAEDSVCLKLATHFTAQDNATDTTIGTWKWNFGNGQSGSGQNINYTYPAAGTYNATVTVTNLYGCASSAAHTIVVLPLPALTHTPDTSICLNQSANLVVSGANNYQWTVNSTLSCTNCANPVASPKTSQRYYVQGISYGCSTFDSLFIDVKQPVKVNVKLADTICIGQSVQLNASGAEVYSWQPSTGLSNSNIANPVATPAATTVYALIGTDSKRCFSDQANVTVQVYPIPEFNIIDSMVTLNVGRSDTLRTTNSEDIVRWQWSPPRWLSCADCPAPIATPQNNITYVARAYNVAGCSSSDRVTIQVLCNGVNVFMPNTFTPNSDGMNDVFYPRGTGLFTVKLLRILNRWGQVVYEKTNFTANAQSDGWNGMYNGAPAEAGIYVYFMEVICENSQSVQFTGNVALLR